MVTNRRRARTFEVAFVFFFRETTVFVVDVAADRFVRAVTFEVVTVNARFEEAVFAVEVRAPRVALVGQFGPTAVVPNDFEVAVVEDDRLRVGDVRRAAFFEVNPAGGVDTFRIAEVEEPARHIEHMDAHIAEGAVPELPEVAPRAATHHRVIREFRRRAGPHIEVEARRRGFRFLLPDAGAAVIAVNVDLADFAELAGVDDLFFRGHQVRRAAALEPDLNDGLVFARGGEHRLAFDDVDADRLLDVNVGAAFDRFDHLERVPVVRRADDDDIEVFFRQHLAIVGILARNFFRNLARRDDFAGFVERFLVDVAEGDDVDRRDLD